MESEAPEESAGAADMAGTEDRMRQMLDTSCVVFDNGSESLRPLKLWDTCLKKLKVLEECEAIYMNPGTDDAERGWLWAVHFCSIPGPGGPEAARGGTGAP